ncbi:hypothetical protein GH714_026763 [Hevea brasiliensis]|uniref:Uncharacterized protein n=1 Tax=Hevea brasiliensis TaxID=3981 RepID=A0A6A6MH11_HEVBR|nr:hypothetical protein GH714_026763 [Hevea brasiliensis]
MADLDPRQQHLAVPITVFGSVIIPQELAYGKSCIKRNVKRCRIVWFGSPALVLQNPIVEDNLRDELVGPVPGGSEIFRNKRKNLCGFLAKTVIRQRITPVNMFKPRTLSEAYSLARLQELPKLPGVPPRNPKLEHHENFKGEKSINGSSLPKSVKVYEGKAYVLVTTKIEQHKKRVGGKKQYMNYGNYGEFDLGAHEKYRNYENCVEFDLSDHDYITLKEDEFERWKRQRKKFYGRVDLLYKKIYKS